MGRSLTGFISFDVPFYKYICACVRVYGKQSYSHLPPILKTIQGTRTKHVRCCLRNKYEAISDVLQWTPAHGCASVGLPGRISLHYLSEDSGFWLEDLQRGINYRDGWRKRVRGIRAYSVTWWWLYIYIYIHIYIYTNTYTHTHTHIYI